MFCSIRANACLRVACLSELDSITPSRDTAPMMFASRLGTTYCVNDVHDSMRPLRWLASRLATCSLLAAIILLGSLGCEDEIPPPPDDGESAASKLMEIDLEHTARFKADREITFSNCVLVWQPDAIDPKASALSLTTSRGAPDGSRFIFGAFVHTASLKVLMETEVDFAGGSMLDLHGNGVFTPLAVYQPRFTKMKIEKIESGNVEGILRGEFHRFRLARPAARPEAIEAELRFKAKLMDRSSGE